MNRDGTLFFTRVGCALCLRACLFPQSYQYPNLSQGADRVGGQLRGDKECPFSGVTKSGRVWRRVPESDARSVDLALCGATLSGVTTLSRFPRMVATPGQLSSLSTFFQALGRKTTQLKQKHASGLAFHFIFHRFLTV